ncbi:MAG TPA: hypothetical protein VJ837_04385 [Candidatus Paceibacterota bacterium]|nr:hypothetical protein [Candidatus Paceibacterota bacterium]
MPSSMREQREIDATASSAFTSVFLLVFGIAALIGLGIGVVWVIAGLLNFHVLR